MSKTQISTGGITDATIATADLADDAVTAAKIADAVTFGKIGQVVEARLTSVVSTTSTSYGVISGFEASITPSASSSKILVFVNVVFSSSNHGHIKFSRDNGSSFVGNGAASGSRDGVSFYSYSAVNTARADSIMFLDTTNTASEITYKAYWRTQSGQTIYLNRTPNDSDAMYGARGASSITLMEVLA